MRSQPKPCEEGLPDRKCPEGPSFPEGTMGYAFFMVIAFVMLGIERLVARYRAHHVTSDATPGS